MRPPCSHSGCPRRHSAKGYCSAHYAQWRRHGTTQDLGPPTTVPIASRILAKATSDGECLIWTGYVMANGYGTIRWRNRGWLVHRAIWTETVGPIPDGLTIDHLCRRRACVNTAHMEVVTLGENAVRGGGLERAWAHYRGMTHCKRGHEFTEENTRIRRGGRVCRACSRVSWREWAVRKGIRRPLTAESEYAAGPAVAV